MAPVGRYRMPPGYAPSQRMLDEVSLDFDGDLGGLKKGPLAVKPSRALMMWAAIAIPIGLMAANVTFGCGFIAGILYGVMGCLIHEAIK